MPVPRWVFADLAGEVICPLGIVFPKIDTVAKPVVIVITGLERLASGKDFLGDLSIATVVTKYKTGGARIQRLSELFGEAYAVR